MEKKNLSQKNYLVKLLIEKFDNDQESLDAALKAKRGAKYVMEKVLKIVEQLEEYKVTYKNSTIVEAILLNEDLTDNEKIYAIFSIAKSIGKGSAKREIFKDLLG